MQHVRELSAKLKAKKGFSLNMLIGLDGFVDEIIHLVDKRIDFDNFIRIRTIAEYGERISRAAGLSTNIEMVTVQTKLGGNGPILSNALLDLGVCLTYMGILGKPDIHPVFRPMAQKAKAVYSLGQPGYSDALEFDDGKIIMGKHFSLREITWDVYKEGMGGIENIALLISQNDLFGMENWTMMPFMSDIWQGLIDEVFPLLPYSAKKPLAFFDLADPEKRTGEDIARAASLISRFEEKFRVILGLNEKELYEIAKVLEIPDFAGSERLKKTTMSLYEKLGIHCLTVHPVRCACCVIDGEYYFSEGLYCEKPKLTTGAGDNYNAGFCLGFALGLDPLLTLALSMSASGYYVRNAKSPTLDELIAFADDWACGKPI